VGTYGPMASSESTRTMSVALVAGLAVALTKVGAAVVTSSPATAAEASHSLADTANDLFFVVAQRRSARPRDEQLKSGFSLASTLTMASQVPKSHRSFGGSRRESNVSPTTCTGLTSCPSVTTTQGPGNHDPHSPPWGYAADPACSCVRRAMA
jgi:Cation efflux family